MLSNKKWQYRNAKDMLDVLTVDTAVCPPATSSRGGNVSLSVGQSVTLVQTKIFQTIRWIVITF